MFDETENHGYCYQEKKEVLKLMESFVKRVRFSYISAMMIVDVATISNCISIFPLNVDG